MDQTGSGAYMIDAALANGGYCIAAGGCSTQTFDGSVFALAIGGALGIVAAIDQWDIAVEAFLAILELGGLAFLAIPFILIALIFTVYFFYKIWTTFISPNLQFSIRKKRIELAVG